MKRILASGAALALALCVDSARSAVTVIGGGHAELCSRAAISGKSDNASEKICTFAIENENLMPRDRAGTYVNRGVLKLRRQSFGSAAKDFDVAAEIAPRMGEAYANRGAALIGLGRFELAVQDLNKGLELGVSEPAKAYFNRAFAYEGLDDEKSAYFDFLKAQELSPDWPLPAKELLRFTVSRKD
jgi:tetratricopeptide (TPR) repeat protein